MLRLRGLQEVRGPSFKCVATFRLSQSGKVAWQGLNFGCRFGFEEPAKVKRLCLDPHKRSQHGCYSDARLILKSFHGSS